MNAVLRRIWRTSIIGNLVAGSLVVLPFVLTVLIIGWAINWIVAAFGPGTWFGDILTTGGEALIGPQREWLAFLIGTVIVLIILWFFGLAVRTRAQRTLQHVLDDVLTKVPLFRAVYRPVSQVVRLFAGSNADLTGLPVVMCRLGGDQGVDVPAFLASNKTFEVTGERRYLVYLPTSPLPAWGGLVLVPEILRHPGARHGRRRADQALFLVRRAGAGDHPARHPAHREGARRKGAGRDRAGRKGAPREGRGGGLISGWSFRGRGGASAVSRKPWSGEVPHERAGSLLPPPNPIAMRQTR